MALNLPKSTEYSGQSRPVGFDPKDDGSAVPALSAELDRQLAGFRKVADADLANQARYNQSLASNREFEAKMRENDWIALSKFSKTLNDYAVGVAKQTQQDISDGAIYDEFMRGFGEEGSPATPASQATDKAEEEAITEGIRQGEQVSALANSVERDTGDIAVAQQVRREFGGLAAGVAGEQALLMRAQSSYGSFLATFMESGASFRLNGQNISVREAVSSGDSRLINAAIAAGRFEFIRSNNLQYATKASFVKYLANTIAATEGSIGAAAVRQGIKDQRAAAVSGIEGLAYDQARTTDSVGVGQLFTEISGQFFRSNTGMSRGEANEAAVKSLIEGFTDTGNVEALEALLDVQQVPNQSGTELRRLYGNLIYDAIDRAEGRQDTLDGRLYNDTLDNLEEQLSQTTDPTQRQSLIDGAADQLEAAGLHRRARELRGQYSELMTDGGHEFNATQMEDAIIRGEIIDPKAVEKAFNRGLITSDERNRLQGLIKQEDFSKDPVVKSVVDTYADSAELYFLQQVGLKKDQFGNTIDPLTGAKPALSPDQARLVLGQIRRDITAIAAGQAQNVGSNDAATLSTTLNATLSGWVKDNLKTDGGKYFVGDLRTSTNGIGQLNAAAVSRVKGYIQPQHLSGKSSIASNQNLKPVDFSNSVSPAGNVAPSVIQQFRANRGDKVFTTGEVKQLFTSWEAGQVSPLLADTADRLGLTPLALLNQQLQAHGFPATAIPQGFDTPSRSTPRAVSNSATGATYLIQRHNLPVRGAAWLSGNIQQESTWNGQRPAWDDGGALSGGLVSWRAGRREAAERFFGRSLTQVSNNEQLDFMMNEMRTTPQYQIGRAHV